LIIIEFVEKIRKSFAENRMNANLYPLFSMVLPGLPAAFAQIGVFGRSTDE